MESIDIKRNKSKRSLFICKNAYLKHGNLQIIEQNDWEKPIFEIALESFIDTYHKFVVVSERIGRETVESEFAEYYFADNGCPSVPNRTMVGIS